MIEDERKFHVTTFRFNMFTEWSQCHAHISIDFELFLLNINFILIGLILYSHTISALLQEGLDTTSVERGNGKIAFNTFH